MKSSKQLVLKPQDLVVAIKVAVNPDRSYLLIDLATELLMALSAVHGSVTRCEQARLLTRAGGSIRHISGAVHEFVVHGAKYCYPGVLGNLTRGIPTGIASPVLRPMFQEVNLYSPVWPDPEGDTYGPSLTPLHPMVPMACKSDKRLYEVLGLLDALRAGAARERELSVPAIAERLA